MALGCLWLYDEQEPGEQDQEVPSFVLLNNIQELPEALLQAMHAVHSGYQKRESRTVGSSYYMNVCDTCGAHFGDHFLFSEPGQGFWPTDEADYARITIRRLAVDGEFQIAAGYSFSGHAHLWEHCQVLNPQGDADHALKAEVAASHAAARQARLDKEQARKAAARRRKKSGSTSSASQATTD